MSLSKHLKKLDIERERVIILRTTADAHGIVGDHELTDKQVAQIIAAYFHNRSILDPGPDSAIQVGLAQAIVTSM